MLSRYSAFWKCIMIKWHCDLSMTSPKKYCLSVAWLLLKNGQMLDHPFEKGSEYWLQAFLGNLNPIVFLAPPPWVEKGIRKHELMMWVCREPKGCWVWDELSLPHLLHRASAFGMDSLVTLVHYSENDSLHAECSGWTEESQTSQNRGGSYSHEPTWLINTLTNEI